MIVNAELTYLNAIRQCPRIARTNRYLRERNKRKIANFKSIFYEKRYDRQHSFLILNYFYNIVEKYTTTRECSVNLPWRYIWAFQNTLYNILALYKVNTKNNRGTIYTIKKMYNSLLTAQLVWFNN